ncbi:hypothetical protein DY000_02046465 [Brassica cretica]|uniref:Uncharacterized protein n=1 Tax=Brassica cretica TaxID=69181 RepID=A0ABQ7F3U3_BRACR|nr:hypothetical protein DY000_02046465 [Brassica cretica]
MSDQGRVSSLKLCELIIELNRLLKQNRRVRSTSEKHIREGSLRKERQSHEPSETTCKGKESTGVGVPHGVLGDIWMHLELKGGEIGDHWTSRGWERGSAATS